VILNKSIAGRAAALLLFFVAALTALDRGGVPALAQSGACALAAVALALALAGHTRSRTPRLPRVTLAPLLVFAMAALQCVPLPAGLLGLLAPVNASLRFFPPAPQLAYAPLTLDLIATTVQLGPLLALACAFTAALLAARSPRIQLLLLAAPVAGALAQLAICVVRLAGEGQFAGTFVNRNHLAALLLLGGLSAMGAALSPPREETPGNLPQLATTRPLWIASAAACSAGALLTLSRGAAVSLLAGALALVALDARAQERSSEGRGGPANGAGSGSGSTPEKSARRRRRRRWKPLWLLVPLAAAFAAALLLSTSPLTLRFQQLSQAPLSNEVKLRSFIGAAKVALEHPLFGVGRGAWRFLAERHRSVPGDMAFLFVENEPLQLAAEEGLPLALAVLLLTALGWFRAARAARSGLSRGVLAGALALALQNLVDFNLAMLGVALPFAIALGAALADERKAASSAAARLARGSSASGLAGANAEEGKSEGKSAAQKVGRVSSPGLARVQMRGWQRVPRPFIAAAALLLLLLAPLPVLLDSRSAEREGARLVFEARDEKTSAEALLADAEATVARHPADWLISLAPAIGLHQRSPRRTAEALAWAGRAQLLAPLAWRPHMVTAAILLRAGRAAQARSEAELSLAALGGIDYGEPMDLAAAASETLDDLLEATPDDPLLRAQVAYRLRVHHRFALARALLEHELARPAGERTRDAQTALETELAWLLQQTGDFAGVADVAERLPRGSCERARLLAEARQHEKRAPAEVEQPLLEVREACWLSRDDLVEMLVRGRIARHDLAGAQALLDDPLLASNNLPFAGEVHRWRAELLEARGDGAQGMHERWLAALLVPDNAGYALEYADRLRGMGDLPGALAALRTLSLRAGRAARAPIDARISEYELQREAQRRAALPR